MSNLDKYSALLHLPWRDSLTEPDALIGRWAEDENTYVIRCPPQLVPLLKGLQNELVAASVELEEAENNVRRLTDRLNNVFKGDVK